MAKTTAAQQRAARKYKEKNIKRVPLEVQKEFYEEIKTAAELQHESINGYIKTAISNRIHSDQEENKGDS